MTRLMIVVFWLSALPVIAQEDSLLLQLRNADADSSKIRLLTELSALTCGSDPAKGAIYANRALVLSNNTGMVHEQAQALRYLGLARYNQARFGEAVDAWLRGTVLFDSVNDLSNLARLYSNIGAVYESQSEDMKALEFNLKSQKVAEQIGDTLRLLSALTNIGAIYGKKEQTFAKALEIDSLALDYAVKKGDRYVEGTLAANMGDIYYKQGNDSLALIQFKRALAAYSVDGNENIPYALLNIGKVYARRGEFTRALDFQQRAYDYAAKTDAKRDMSAALNALGGTRFRMQSYADALEMFHRAESIARLINAKTELREAYEGLADSYKKLGDYKNAYTFQNRLTLLKDTLYNMEYTQKMEGLILNFEIDKKQNQITILNKDKELQEADLKRQKLAKNAFLAGLILILFIAFIIFRNYRAKVKINKILDRQKDEIESLLLNILPVSVAHELKTDGKATPRSYEAITVLFSDFSGFTTIAQSMTPEELVSELNEIFSAFDEITDRNHLEKIKTIGDAYMCAGGIPTANTTHAVDAVRAGLEIQKYMTHRNEQRAEKGMPLWELRVGIHSGPVTAGVVGKRKYAYDIWGDAVNIASRMESSGVTGRVNISAATYERVQQVFECNYRGKIHAKNVGEIDMYFVVAEKADINSRLMVSGNALS